MKLFLTLDSKSESGDTVINNYEFEFPDLKHATDKVKDFISEIEGFNPEMYEDKIRILDSQVISLEKYIESKDKKDSDFEYEIYDRDRKIKKLKRENNKFSKQILNIKDSLLSNYYIIGFKVKRGIIKDLINKNKKIVELKKENENLKKMINTFDGDKCT